MTAPDPRFQRMADRHAARQRKQQSVERTAELTRRAESMRGIAVTPRQPGESEPIDWDPSHLGHRSHLCLGMEGLCQCGVSRGSACFVMPSEPMVFQCPVCAYHGLPRGVPWLYEPPTG